MKFKCFPKILAIQLNRFELDYTTFMRRKINDKVTFPHVINVNEFMKDYKEINSEALRGNNTGPAMSSETSKLSIQEMNKSFLIFIKTKRRNTC